MSEADDKAEAGLGSLRLLYIVLQIENQTGGWRPLSWLLGLHPTYKLYFLRDRVGTISEASFEWPRALLMAHLGATTTLT